MRSQAQHSALESLPVEGDNLLFAGRTIEALAAEVGSTPFYAYDKRAMTGRVASLRKLLPAGVHLHYAMKANPHPAVVAHVASLVDGLDVASAGELAVALGTGVSPGAVSFAGPGKRAVELERAAAAGIVVNLESPREMAALAAIGAKLGVRPKAAVRVNPAFEIKASGMKMSGAKQFGVDTESVPELLSDMRKLPLEFCGFHIFSGSQSLNADAIVDAQAKSVELAIELARVAPDAVRILNIGGGFGIPYFPGDAPLDVARIGEHLGPLCRRVAAALPEAALVIELGRYLVGEAGIYVCRIVDRKISRGQIFLVTDGGLHHHLAASGNFGQVIRKNYPVLIGNRVRGARRETVSVVGPLCTPLDLLADRMEMAEAQVGDLVVVLQSGAYGLTASPAAFLSHPAPVEAVF